MKSSSTVSHAGNESGNIVTMYIKRGVFIMLAMFVLSGCLYVEPTYDYRNDVVGYYQVEEYSHTYNDEIHYYIDIAKSGYSSDAVTISNFYAANISVKAYVSYDKLTIPFQVVNGYEIEGTGTIYGSKLKMNYSVKDRYENDPTDFCEVNAYLN